MYCIEVYVVDFDFYRQTFEAKSDHGISFLSPMRYGTLISVSSVLCSYSVVAITHNILSLSC